MKDLSHRLREELKRLKLRHIRFAEISGWHKTTISQWVRGIRRVPTSAFKMLYWYEQSKTK